MEKGQDIGNIANEDLSKIREKGMEECINGWMRRGRRRRGITKGEILKEQVSYINRIRANYIVVSDLRRDGGRGTMLMYKTPQTTWAQEKIAFSTRDIFTTITFFR